MIESQLRNVFICAVYPKDSERTIIKRFRNFDNGSMGGFHCLDLFFRKIRKSFHFDSFGGYPDKYLLNQLPKLIIKHNYKIQDINIGLCGTYHLIFFYLEERMGYHSSV